jgi:hypothetical protein
VQDIQDDVVVTQKSVLDKDKFYLLKNMVDRFIGQNVWFTMTKEDAFRTIINPNASLPNLVSRITARFSYFVHGIPEKES